jgi:hypothetical protein
MDYNKGYEELREVYLKDKWGEMFKIILNNECCPHGMHPSAKHGHFRCRYNGINEMCSKNICPLDTDLQAKHDELVELIKQVHHEIKGITRCRVGFIGEYQVYCCQLERYRIDRLEAALRKTVE